jgi:hypothetical protein
MRKDYVPGRMLSLGLLRGFQPDWKEGTVVEVRFAEECVGTFVLFSIMTKL